MKSINFLLTGRLLRRNILPLLRQLLVAQLFHDFILIFHCTFFINFCLPSLVGNPTSSELARRLVDLVMNLDGMVALNSRTNWVVWCVYTSSRFMGPAIRPIWFNEGRDHIVVIGQGEILSFYPTVAKTNRLCSGRVGLLSKHALLIWEPCSTCIPARDRASRILVIPIKYLNALRISPDQCVYAYINAEGKKMTSLTLLSHAWVPLRYDRKAREN